MKTYHVIKNGKRIEISAEELNALTESKEEILLDVEWYLNNGAITLEDYKKKHQTNDSM